ncbi:MAG: VanZ family protein [Leptothrix sp. (in: b-proteobacteria)]
MLKNLCDLLGRPLSRRLAGATASAMLLAIYILGSYPAVVDEVVVIWDKAVHFSAYGVIAGLWLVALRSPWQAVALTTVGGALDEIHQLFVPGRSAGLDDLSADFLGALTVCLLGLALARRISTGQTRAVLGATIRNRP